MQTFAETTGGGGGRPKVLREPSVVWCMRVKSKCNRDVCFCEVSSSVVWY